VRYELRFQEEIILLYQEICGRKKKGKLPVDATVILKEWWSKNLVWPYPSVSSSFCVDYNPSNFAGRGQERVGSPDWIERHSDQQLVHQSAKKTLAQGEARL